MEPTMSDFARGRAGYAGEGAFNPEAIERAQRITNTGTGVSGQNDYRGIQPIQRRTNEVNQYQDWTTTTANGLLQPGHDPLLALAYATLGVVGEAGEVLSRVIAYDVVDILSMDRQERVTLLDEIGDVAWYAARLPAVFDVTLEQTLDTATFTAYEQLVAESMTESNGDDWERVFGLMDAAAGLSAVTGLLANKVKKVLGHGYTVAEAKEQIIEQIEQIWHYVAVLSILCNTTLHQIVDGNIFKLEARHGSAGGFQERRTAL
jgi:NTP pyrophosphatase (non-canonical NTP hydrolase)